MRISTPHSIALACGTWLTPPKIAVPGCAGHRCFWRFREASSRVGASTSTRHGASLAAAFVTLAVVAIRKLGRRSNCRGAPRRSGPAWERKPQRRPFPPGGAWWGGRRRPFCRCRFDEAEQVAAGEKPAEWPAAGWGWRFRSLFTNRTEQIGGQIQFFKLHENILTTFAPPQRTTDAVVQSRQKCSAPGPVGQTTSTSKTSAQASSAEYNRQPTQGRRQGARSSIAVAKQIPGIRAPVATNEANDHRKVRWSRTFNSFKYSTRTSRPQRGRFPRRWRTKTAVYGYTPRNKGDSKLLEHTDSLHDRPKTPISHCLTKPHGYRRPSSTSGSSTCPFSTIGCGRASAAIFSRKIWRP